MTEDKIAKVSEESMATTATATKQRKKRKWDQPAESFVSAGLALPGVLPFGNYGSLGGFAIPGTASLTGTLLTSPVPVPCSITSQAFQVPSNQATASTILQKLNLPKIQDELIAREIVINDAESTVRYKLTKRQTQEEIQRCTGAVVITRGKYRPPNALPDSGKPLYLHISAGSHLKETAERIIAVDQAAAMVEEMLKQSQSSNFTATPSHSAISVGGQVSHPLSACVFLGFNIDSSWNIDFRIRGPNDQYINHIMNETGATVALRGQGSGNSDSVAGEGLPQPLHLYLSAENPKSLEDAKLLAENLLDTIAVECGTSRVTSSKAYKAVPPPPQLLGGVNSLGVDQRVASISSPLMDSSQVGVSQPGGLPVYGQPQPNTVSYPQTSVCGMSCNGYGGIYPQATPLQQVALVLRQSLSVISFTAPATTPVSTANVMETEKRPPQKRKFQELPATSKLAAEPYQNSPQRSEFVKPGAPYEYSNSRTTSTMPPPKKLAGMPPPPPRSMPPPPSKLMPPPPPRPNLMSSATPSKPPPSSVSDTLFKLMEYGDDDDDDDDNDPREESEKSKLKPVGAPKPFWAL